MNYNKTLLEDYNAKPEDLDYYKGKPDEFLSDYELSREDAKALYGMDVDSTFGSKKTAQKPAATPAAPAPRAGFDSWQGLAQSGKEFVGKVKDVFAHEADRTTALAEGARTKVYQEWEKDWKDWNARKAQARLRRTEFKEPAPKMDGEKYVRNHGFGGVGGFIDDAAAAFRVPTKIVTAAVQSIPGVGGAVRAGRGYLAPKVAYQAAVDEQGAKGGEPDLYELGLRAQEIADVNAKQASLDDLADPTSRGIVQATKDMWTGIKEDPHSLAYDLTDPGTTALGMGVGALGKTATAAVDASKAGQAAKLIAQSRKGLMAKTTGAVKDLGTKVGMQKMGINAGEFATDVVTGSAAGGDELSSDNLIGQLPVALGMMGTSKVGDLTVRGAKALAKRALKGKRASAGVGAGKTASGTESTGITIDMTPPDLDAAIAPPPISETPTGRKMKGGAPINSTLDSAVAAARGEDGTIAPDAIVDLAIAETERRKATMGADASVKNIADASKAWIDTMLPEELRETAKARYDEAVGNMVTKPVAVTQPDGTVVVGTEQVPAATATQKPKAEPSKKQELSDKRAELEAHYDEVRTSGLTDDELLADLVEHAKSLEIPAKKIVAEITTANPEVSSKFNGNPNLKNRARVMAGDPPLVLKDGRNVGGTINDFPDTAKPEPKIEPTKKEKSQGFAEAKLAMAERITNDMDAKAARRAVADLIDDPTYNGQGRSAFISALKEKRSKISAEQESLNNKKLSKVDRDRFNAFAAEVRKRKNEGATGDEIMDMGLRAEEDGVRGAFGHASRKASEIDKASGVGVKKKASEALDAKKAESDRVKAEREAEKARKLEASTRGTWDQNTQTYLHPESDAVRQRTNPLTQTEMRKIAARYNKLPDGKIKMAEDFPEIGFENNRYVDKIPEQALEANTRIAGFEMTYDKALESARAKIKKASTKKMFMDTMTEMAKNGYFSGGNKGKIPAKLINEFYDKPGTIAGIQKRMKLEGATEAIGSYVAREREEIAKAVESSKYDPRNEGVKLMASPQVLGTAAITTAMGMIDPALIGPTLLGSAALGLALRNLPMPKAFEMLRTIRKIFADKGLSLESWIAKGTRALAEVKNLRTAESSMFAALTRAKEMGSARLTEVIKDVIRRFRHLSAARYIRSQRRLQLSEDIYHEYFKKTGADKIANYGGINRAINEIFHVMEGREDLVPEDNRAAAIAAARRMKTEVTDVIHREASQARDVSYLADWAPRDYNRDIMKALRLEADQLGWTRMDFGKEPESGSFAHEALYNMDKALDKYLYFDGVNFGARDGATPLIAEAAQYLNDGVVSEADVAKFLVGNKLPSFLDASIEKPPATIKDGERHDARLENERRLPYLGSSFYQEDKRASLANYIRSATAANINQLHMPNELLDNFLAQMAEPDDGKYLYGTESETRDKLGIAQDGSVNREAGIANLLTRAANGKMAVGGAASQALDKLTNNVVRPIVLNKNPISAVNAPVDYGVNALARNPTQFLKSAAKTLPKLMTESALGQYAFPEATRKARSERNKKGIGIDTPRRTRDLVGMANEATNVFNKSSGMTDELAIQMGIDELKAALDDGKDLSDFYNPLQLETLKAHWNTDHPAIDELKLIYALPVKSATSGHSDTWNLPEIYNKLPGFRSTSGLFKTMPLVQNQIRNIEVMLGKDGQISADRAVKLMANMARGSLAGAWRATMLSNDYALVAAILAATGSLPILGAVTFANWVARNHMNDDERDNKGIYRDDLADAMIDKRLTDVATDIRDRPLTTLAGMYASSVAMPVSLGMTGYGPGNEFLSQVSGERGYTSKAADIVAANAGSISPAVKGIMDVGGGLINYGPEGALMGGIQNIPMVKYAVGRDFMERNRLMKSKAESGTSKAEDASRVTNEQLKNAANLKAWKARLRFEAMRNANTP